MKREGHLYGGALSLLRGIEPRTHTREGLKETPDRVAKAWAFWTSGYDQDVADLIKVFADGAEGVDEMIVEVDIPFYSHCVVGSTFVETPRGRVPIKHLKDGDLIYTMDPVSFDLSIVPCVKPGITKRNAKLVQIHTDNDSLICTPDHRVLKTDGTWVEAQHLKSNDRLASLYRGFLAGRDAGTGESTAQYSKAYPVLMASRYTRHEKGISIQGECRAVVEHRFVSEYFNPGCYPKGRKLVTHHIDETTFNNLPDNLEVKTQREHNYDHNHGQRLAHHEGRKAAAAEASGRPETRAKRAASVKASWERRKAEPANHVVFGVEHLDYQEDVYCMTVPGTHLFFANGIAAHNCEHHLAPFFGLASVAYIPQPGPDGRVLGLSKMNRLVDLFARRLQVQERLTNQIADAMEEHLKPLGVGVLIRARHMCVESRGVQHRGCSTTTSALRGVIKTQPHSRAEFLALANTKTPI